MHGGDPQAAAGVREGQILAGKYRVERVLGIGGMGVVVAAHHMQLDTKVAIKFLLPAMLESEQIIGRFANEARRAAKITSEHVARVHDVGTLDDGAPYMVMEYLEGADLSTLLHEQGRLPLEQAVDFVLEAMEAIAEAHTLGIVHRDLKPANLFCIRRPDGKLSIKVLDFGISKATRPGGARSLSMTATSALIGSPFYMSPEQMEASASVDARTDIWALGIIVFELLAGRVPFYAETIPEVCIKVAIQPPPPLRSFRPDAPEGLQAVIAMCLEKARERRYQNTADLALALSPFGSKRAKVSVERITDIIQTAGLSVTAPALPAPPAPASQPRVETMAPLGRTTPGAKSGKAVVRAAFAVVGVLTVGGGYAAFRHFDGGLQAVHADRPGAPPEGHGIPESCAPRSTRCSGLTLETCSDGRWNPGLVTGGQCGAACTPGSSPTRCNGNVPEACTPEGQWQPREACPFVCSNGNCSGECIPGTTHCAGNAGVHTCGPDGQWQRSVLCNRSSVCRDGACVPSFSSRPTGHDRGAGPAATAPPAPAPPTSSPSAPLVPSPAPSLTPPVSLDPNCSPPYTIDSAGHRQYKPECP
jgi:serine/threonine-protein kinase